MDDRPLQRIAELLRQPDDLAKIPSLIERVTKAKQLVDAQLDADLRKREHELMTALSQFNQSQQKIKLVKDETKRIDKICSTGKDRVEDFALIGRISKVHSNFAMTYRMVENLRTMHAELDSIEKCLEDEDNDEEEMGHSEPYLLNIHYKLMRLNTFRDQALTQAIGVDSDVRSSLVQYFERLDQVNESFEERIWSISSNLMWVAESGLPDLAVRLACIIDAEERADARAQALNSAVMAHDGANRSILDKRTILQGQNREVRGFLDKFFRAVKQSADDKFREFKEQQGSGAILEKSGWIFKDITRIRDALQNCFPRSWNFTFRFTEYYHKNVHDCLQEIIAAEPDAATILELLSWIETYYERLHQRFGIERNSLQPALVDGKQEELIDDYLGMFVRKQHEWMGKLFDDDVKVFRERTGEPEEVDQEYVLPGFVHMFQMLSQQVDVAASSGQERVLCSVIQELLKTLQELHDKWDHVLKEEADKQVTIPDQVPVGLVEYTIALANGVLKSINFAHDILDFAKPKLAAHLYSSLEPFVNNSLTSFVDFVDNCAYTIVRIIGADIEVPCSALFTSAWYGGDQMGMIVATVKDYWEIIVSKSAHSLSNMLLLKIWQYIFGRYILAARSAKSVPFKKKNGAVIDQIRKDMIALVEFNRSSGANDTSLIQDYLRIIDLVILNLVQTESIEDVEAYVTAVRENYPEVTSQVLEDLLSKHQSLDRSTTKASLSFIRSLPQTASEDSNHSAWFTLDFRGTQGA